MLREQLKNYNIILASGSPRRQNFFKELDIDFTIDVREVEEVFSPTLKRAEITDFLAELKASVFSNLNENDIGKPKDAADAKQMLLGLSGDKHQVYTSVTFTSKNFQKTVHDKTDVYFGDITPEQVDYYIKTCKPFDKAGSYGIQDWLGYVGIEKIDGCFFNVMGLPTRLVYKTLMTLAAQD